MKVVFLFSHPAPYKVDFFNELSKYVEVTVLFERRSNKDRDEAFYNRNSYQFNAIFLGGINIGKENHYSANAVSHLKQNHYDLIVINGWRTFTEMKVIEYLKRNRIPYVFYINGGIAKENEPIFITNVKNRYISGADLYFSPDEASNIYLLHYGAIKENIINYPYSTIFENEILKSPLSKQNKDELRKSLDLPENVDIILSVGQFIGRKNFFGLLEMWKDMPKDKLLVLIGGGKLKRKFLKYISSNKLSNVILHDFMNKNTLLKYMQAADLFVFPSLEDIYGHVINESLTQGLPVVSSMYVNAAKKLVKDGYNGFLYKPGCNDDFKTKIIKTLENRSEYSLHAIESSKDSTIENMARFHAREFKEWVNKE
ncbi:MAG: glycosyltransferase family 4 protein [Bacilli bacterium]